jgi:hypothetical protein
MLRKLSESSFRAPRDLTINYADFKGGLNTLFRQIELRPNELAQADNLMLIGRGVPTKRWGSQNYFLSGVTGYNRGLFHAKKTGQDPDVLAVTDWGYAVKKNGASYTMLTGASWASGYNVEMTQLKDNVYFFSESREMVRYDFSTLVSFTTIAMPTGVSASNISGASGTYVYSWRVAALSQVGETLGSSNATLVDMPQTLADTRVYVQWTPTSAASGVLTGYAIYRGAPGDEVYVGNVEKTVNQFFDDGIAGSLLRQPKEADTTGGVKAKYVSRYLDRIIVAGVENDPTIVMISGRVPQQERFDWAAGGGTVQVDEATGDDVSGLAIHQKRIIVFKEESVWQVTLANVTAGNYLLLEPTYSLITSSQGCLSHRSICAVDNDLLFLGRKGVYVLGYEPNITADVLRTNELSAKIRPFFETLSNSDLKNATATYFDYKYILAFPDAKKCIIFDKERVAWMGPWSTSFGINKFIRHVDVNGVEHLLAADADDNYVSEFSSTLTDDKGTAFGTVLKTRKEDFGDWTLFKTLQEVYMNFRNVAGTVGVNILTEDRDGNVTTAKSFNVNAPTSQITADWGADLWGQARWGTSNVDAESFAEETIKRAPIFKTCRYIQYEVTTSERPDNYELLNLRAIAIPAGVGGFNYSWNVDQ